MAICTMWPQTMWPTNMWSLPMWPYCITTVEILGGQIVFHKTNLISICGLETNLLSVNDMDDTNLLATWEGVTDLISSLEEVTDLNGVMLLDCPLISLFSTSTNIIGETAFITDLMDQSADTVSPGSANLSYPEDVELDFFTDIISGIDIRACNLVSVTEHVTNLISIYDARLNLGTSPCTDCEGSDGY